MEEIEFILYVKNQKKSTAFYQELLLIKPSLNVPGMTEDGIAKIILERTPHPSQGNGIPRCELYLKVTDANKYIVRGTHLGGKLISEFKFRDWEDTVGYISDLDGHIIAFAEK